MIFIEIYVIIFQQKQNKEGCKLYIRFDGECRVKWIEGKEYGFIALPDGKRAFVLKKVAWLGLNDEWGRPHIPGERIFYPELIKTPKGLWTVQYVGEWRLKEYEKRLELAKEGWQKVFEIAIDLCRPWWRQEDEDLRQIWLASGRQLEFEILLLKHREQESQLREEFYNRIEALINLHDYYSGLVSGRYGIARGGYGADPEKIKGAIIIDRTYDVGHYHLYWAFAQDVPEWLRGVSMGEWIKAACEQAAKEQI